jgi:predicted nucleic acid-binding protein/Arc/MetJ family transcription regulator
MRTNNVLDDSLVTEAIRVSGARIKREVIDLALREFVARSRQRKLKDLVGRDLIDSNYDVRAVRRTMTRVLVDTTVWIGWLRATDSPATRRLAALLDEGEAVLAPVILPELLQGASSPQSLRTLQRRCAEVPMPAPQSVVDVYARAGSLCARCRWQGVRSRGPHDYLIASLAVEHGVALLYDDRDVELIASIEPELTLCRDGCGPCAAEAAAARAAINPASGEKASACKRRRGQQG